MATPKKIKFRGATYVIAEKKMSAEKAYDYLRENPDQWVTISTPGGDYRLYFSALVHTWALKAPNGYSFRNRGIKPGVKESLIKVEKTGKFPSGSGWKWVIP